MTDLHPPADREARVDLDIGGMTCAARVERELNRLDGARASVNFATGTATVAYDPVLVEPGRLVAAVEAAGYTATLPPPPSPVPVPADGAPGAGSGPAAAEADEADALRQRLLVCAALTVPVVALAMLPAAQFRFWQWLSLTLAAPVVVGRLAVPSGRRGQRPASDGHHGHADLGRRAGRAGLVGVGAVPRRDGRAGPADAVPPAAVH